MEESTFSSRKLRSLTGQRRRLGRGNEIAPTPVLLIFEDKNRVPATLVAIDFGRITFEISPQEQVASIALYRVVDHVENILIEGNWILLADRKTGLIRLVTFEIKGAENLLPFEFLIGPETFLKPNRYRLFSLEDKDGSDAFSLIFTEIKDCPVALQAQLKNGVDSIKCKFDFSSGVRDLSHLSFKADRFEEKFKNRIFVADFSFLCVRYLLNLSIEDHDKDFGLIICRVLGPMLSVTNRLYERHGCDITIKIAKNDLTFDGTIVEINGKGGLLVSKHSKELGSLLDEEFEISEPISQTKFKVEGVRKLPNGLAFHFIKEGSSPQDLANLVFAHLKEPIVIRRSENYEEFIRLYANVGYSPSNSEQAKAWREDTIAAWNEQDKLIPNSCLGYKPRNEELACSVGSIPWGKRIVYAHSLAMKKSLTGAFGLFDQMVLSFCWLEIIHGIEYSGGAITKDARFTSRLLSNFRDYSGAESQIVINSFRYSLEKIVIDWQSQYHVRQINEDALLEFTNKVPAPVGKFVEMIAQPHPMIATAHQTNVFIVEDESKSNFSIVVQNLSPKYFTASNLFQRIWVFNASGKMDIKFVASALKHHLGKISGPLVQVIGNGSISPSPIDVDVPQEGGVWTFTKKDDICLVNASIARAAYWILKKYSGVDNLLNYKLFNA